MNNHYELKKCYTRQERRSTNEKTTTLFGTDFTSTDEPGTSENTNGRSTVHWYCSSVFHLPSSWYFRPQTINPQVLSPQKGES